MSYNNIMSISDYDGKNGPLTSYRDQFMPRDHFTNFPSVHGKPSRTELSPPPVQLQTVDYMPC